MHWRCRFSGGCRSLVQGQHAPGSGLHGHPTGDGLSFDIFKKAQITAPVIFTTAFNEYALRAFKTNSLDYLLKPIDKKELANALTQFNEYIGRRAPAIDSSLIDLLTRQIAGPEYTKRFLIKSGGAISYITVEEIAYLYSDSGLTFLVTTARKKHNIDYTLEQLEDLLDPQLFFRINRGLIVHYQSVTKAAAYFNSRLKLTLQPNGAPEAIVSREKVKGFKTWLGS